MYSSWRKNVIDCLCLRPCATLEQIDSKLLSSQNTSEGPSRRILSATAVLSYSVSSKES